MPIKPLALAGFALGGLAVVEGARLCSCRATAHAQAPTVSSRTVIIHVDGMDCPACTTSIHIALKKLDGVQKATVSYAAKEARVVYAPGRVTPEELVAAVKRLGYRASLPGNGS